MPTSVITNTITTPSGGPLANIPVKIYLATNGSVSGGFRISDGSEVASETSTTTNGSGVWSATLERNSNITPAGTYYIAVEEITEDTPAQGLSRTWAFLVGATNQTLQAALITQPPAVTPPTSATALILAGNNTFTGTQNFNSGVFFASGKPWYDVQAAVFGALGDGVTDDTVAIQAAITAAVATGGVVFFPIGKYVTTSTLTVPDNNTGVSFVGQGISASVIRTPDTGIGINIGSSSVGSIKNYYVEMHDLSVASVNFSTDAVRVKINKTNQSYFNRVSFSDGGVGLELNQVSATQFLGCNFTNNNQYGINMANCDQVQFTGGYFEGDPSNSPGQLVHIHMGSGNTHNSFTGNGFSPGAVGGSSYYTQVLIADGGASNYNVFTGNTIKGVDYGLQIGPLAASGSVGWTITGNTIKGRSDANSFGVILYGTLSTVTGNSVSLFTDSIRESTTGGAQPNSNTVIGNDVDVRPVLNPSTSAGNLTVYGMNTLGNTKLGSAQSIIMGTTGTGGGSQVVAIANSTTVPSLNLAGGCIYASSGYLVWRGSGGTATEIANP